MASSIKIGVTGGIASGKTSLAQILTKDYALNCFDADNYAHQLLHEKSIVNAIKIQFPEAIDENNAVNRKILAQLVFSDPIMLGRLNDIMHPPIVAGAKAFLRAHSRVVVDAALLWEVELQRSLDATIAVICAPQTQVLRIRRRNKLSEKAAWQRVHAQNSNAYRVVRADYIVWNCAGIDVLRAQAQNLAIALFNAQNFCHQ
ncbi:MAG: dephospho-CoA kinase [Bradymonadales bacterium]